MFEMLKSGGFLMLPIAFCAIIATFIIIERSIYFNTIRKNDKKLMRSVKKFIFEKKYLDAQKVCTSIATPTAQVIQKAVQCRNWDEKDFNAAVEAEMTAVIPQFEHLLTALSTIANISTLLGLLGTVTGNIKAFGVLGAGGSMGNPALLAGSIAEALVTTAAGLAISIPSLIFSNYFVSRVSRRTTEMESNVTEIAVMLLGRVH